MRHYELETISSSLFLRGKEDASYKEELEDKSLPKRSAPSESEKKKKEKERRQAKLMRQVLKKERQKKTAAVEDTSFPRFLPGSYVFNTMKS